MTATTRLDGGYELSARRQIGLRRCVGECKGSGKHDFDKP